MYVQLIKTNQSLLISIGRLEVEICLLHCTDDTLFMCDASYQNVLCALH